MVGRAVLFFALTSIGLAADLWTKSYMFRHYFDPELARQHLPQQVHWWIDGVLGHQTSTNPGALFGMGAGLSWLFAAISIVAIVGIVIWLFVAGAARDRWLVVTLGLITAGILGNLYDRLGFGYVSTYPAEIRDNVRDWILFRIEGVRGFDPWPNFNIADSLLVVGAILLCLHAFMAPPASDDDADAGESDNAAGG